jgi:uncharacterized HAD superfamily protein
MSKQIIGVDIDDVLGAQNEGMRLFVNEHYGLSHTAEEYQAEGPYWGYWEMVWGVDDEEGERRWRAYMDNGGLKKLMVVPHAVEVIQKLKHNYTLVILTARQEEFRTATHDWLDRHFPQAFQGVEFIPAFHTEKPVTKAEVAKRLGVAYLIDDNLEHCTLAAQAGIECLLFGDFGWNKAKTLPPNITRVTDWPAIEKYFDGKHTQAAK